MTMKSAIIKKVLSLFILIGFVFIFVGCDLSMFTLDLNEDDENENNKNQPQEVVEVDINKQLFEYYYANLSQAPYSFNLWYSLYQENNITFVLKDNVIYFVDKATNKEYLYFNLNDLNNNPLNLTIIDSNNIVYVKDSEGKINLLFSYEILNVNKEHHIQFFDDETFLKEIVVNHNATLSSAFIKAGVSTNLTKEGFEFLGWYVDVAGKVFSTTELASFNITEDVKVFARWKEGQSSISYYKIQFYDDNEFLSDMTVQKSSKLIDALNLAGFDVSPKKDGYEFLGWYVDVEGHILSNYEIYTYLIKSDIIVRAQWKKQDVNTYTVSFYDNEEFISSINVSYHTTLSEAFNKAGMPTTLSKDNYKFEGWFVDRLNRILPVYDFSTYYVSSNLNVSARWTENFEYINVTISDGYSNECTSSILKGDFLSDVLKTNGFAVNPTRDNYTFVGWSVNNFVVSSTDAYNYKISKDAFIQAMWDNSQSSDLIQVYFYANCMFISHEIEKNTSLLDFLTEYDLPSEGTRNNPNYIGLLVNQKEIYKDYYYDFYLEQNSNIEVLYKDGIDNYVEVSDEIHNNNVITIHDTVILADLLTWNEFEILPSRLGYKFLGWYVNDELVPTDLIYNYQIIYNPSNVTRFIVQARWQKISDLDPSISILTSPFLSSDNSYNVTIYSDNSIKANKTATGNEWDCLMFEKLPDINYECYPYLYVRFKGPEGSNIIFKFNDNSQNEYFWTCTGEEDELTIEIKGTFDYNKYAIVIFLNGGISGKTGDYYIYEMNLTNSSESTYSAFGENDLSLFSYNLNENEKTICITSFSNPYANTEDLIDIYFSDSYTINGQEYIITGIGDFALQIWNLRSIRLPNTLKKIGNYTFYGCQNLTELILPESLEEIGEACFGNTGLSSIIIPKNVSNIEGCLFMDCEFMEVVTVDPLNKSYDSRDNCNAIIEIKTNKLISACNNTTIPNSVKEIRNNAYYLIRIKDLIIPEGVERIDDGAFRYCHSLETVSIPASVTYFGSDNFEGCNELKSLSVNPNNRVYDSRDNCNAIIETATNKLIAGTSYTVIPSSVSIIGALAFIDRENITNLDIPNGVISIENSAFQDLRSLQSLNIPSSLRSIGFAAFLNCSNNLLTITVSPDNPYYYSVDNTLLERNTNTLILSNHLGTIPEETRIIGAFAAFYNQIIKDLIIPSNVTRIEHAAFMCCYNLESVVIPKSVTYIANQAFDQSDKLKTVYFTGTQEEWNSIDISDSNDSLTNANIIFNYNN